MSIIADTLKRLQAHSSGATPGELEGRPLPPRFNQGEGPGRHRKDSRLKFSIIGIGMGLGLGALALSAYWIGWHLDFGFSPNTHARVANSRALTIPPMRLEMQNTTPSPPDSLVSVFPDTPLPPAPMDQTNREPSSQVPNSTLDNPTTQNNSPTQISTTSLSRVTPPTPSRPRTLPDQNATIASIDQTHTDSELTLSSEPNSEGRMAMLEESEQLTLDKEPSFIDMIIEEKTKQANQATPTAASIADVIVVDEEVIKSTTPLQTSAVSPIHITTPQKRPESSSLKKTPRTPSSANQLRHAQQLIRSGKYEDAVTLLSPLFHEPPVKWEPWFWMGTALLGKGEMEQADQFFLSGLARNDKIPQLWIQRAIVAQQGGDYQLAIHELRQAESLEADLPHIHLNMGYAYEQLGNHQLANQYYGKFLKLSEGQPTFFTIRKKLFARITGQTPTVKVLPPSSPLP